MTATTMSEPSASPSVSRESLGDCAVLGLDGSALTLRSLWVDRTVVLVFVRHFGCLFCKEQVADVLAQKARFDATGAEIVIVGNGSVEEARAFERAQAPGLRIVTDPTREAYCAAGMKSGLSTSFSPRIIAAGMRAMKKGHRQTRTEGSALQQGGVVVMAPPDRELFRHVSDVAGDHPRLEDVLASLAR